MTFRKYELDAEIINDVLESTLPEGVSMKDLFAVPLLLEKANINGANTRIARVFYLDTNNGTFVWENTRRYGVRWYCEIKISSQKTQNLTTKLKYVKHTN